MNKKRLKGYLTASVFLGGVIDFFAVLIAGVFDRNLYNYIVTGICAVIPFIIFSIFVIVDLYKYGRINLKKAIILMIIFIIICFLGGSGIEFLICRVFGVDITNVNRMVNTLYKTLIGVIVATNINNIYYSLIRKKD